MRTTRVAASSLLGVCSLFSECVQWMFTEVLSEHCSLNTLVNIPGTGLPHPAAAMASQ